LAGNPTSLLALETSGAFPRIDQSALLERYVSYLETKGAGPKNARLASLIFNRSRIDSRQVLEGDSSHHAEWFLEGDQERSTSARMELYRRFAPPISEEVARRALDSAGVSSFEVGLLVFVSCTTPGDAEVDQELAIRLGLSPSADRVQLCWMSCSAAFPALRLAQRFCESNPSSVAVVVSTELCSLHMRVETDTENMVGQALFGDGAAALVLGGAAYRTESELCSLGQSKSMMLPKSRHLLRWHFGDTGFQAHISREIPKVLADGSAKFLESFSQSAEDRWCVHPGGASILDALEGHLGLSASALTNSRAVLSAQGNLSSATVLHVLERELSTMNAGERGLMLGFGTGLTIEGQEFWRGTP